MPQRRPVPILPLRLVPRRAAKAWGEEIWLNSTRPEFPAAIAGGGDLAQLLRRRPQLLGAWSRRLFGKSLPVFAKFISTDFPPLAHIGFKSLVRPQEFLGWICREQDMLGVMRRSLRVPDCRAFRGFAGIHERWAADRALARWDAAPKRDRRFVKAVSRFSRLDQPDLARLTEDLRRSHQRIVRVLNEVDLRREAGNLLMIKAGLVHALFGLSLQFHPRDPSQEYLQEFILSSRGRSRAAQKLRAARLKLPASDAPKSEAWLPLPSERRLRLAEVQQSSNCTYSVADFFTPFIWEKGARFRKGHPISGLGETMLRSLIGSMDFSVTTLAGLRCRPQPLDPGPRSSRCRFWRLLDQPALWPFFTVHRLDLEEDARWDTAGTETFTQIVALSGQARLEAGRRVFRLSPRTPAFVPAGLAGSYALTAQEPSSLLLVSIPRPRRP